MNNPALTIAARTGLMLAVAAWLTTMPRLGAQSSLAPAASPAFDVASVKANKSGDQRVMIQMPPTGRFTATNIPLRLLVRLAFDVQDFQLVGGPSWLTSDRFDIAARAPESAKAEEGAKAPESIVTPDQIRPMLRALLADRFKLMVHNDTREMPIYSLILARPDGKFGPKLNVAKVDCQALFSGRRGAPPPPPPPAPGQLSQPIDCGFFMGIGSMTAGGMPMGELARSLSQLVGRIVLDKTGLKERYDFQLAYAPEGRGFGPGPGPGGPEAAPIDPNTPSLFTALQEQLGLKLESERGPVDVVVIDRVEQPTED